MKRVISMLLALVIFSQHMVAVQPETVKLGYVLGNDVIGIRDAVEILTYLAELESIIYEDERAFKAALITGGTVPTIQDAVEILCYLARLPNLIEGDNYVPPEPPPPPDWYTANAVEKLPSVIKNGIDVSRWQGDINWEQVAAANVDFAMLRIGVGAFTDRAGRYFPDSMDVRFREYITEAQKHGIDVGVYFYSYAQTISEIQREAHYLVGILKEFRITYPVALDIEEPRENYIDSPSSMVEAFFEIIVEAGYFPMICTFKSFLENYLSQEVREKYAVWVAHYGVPATTYQGRYYMWQYSSTGSVSGIGTVVDLNIAYRDLSGLHKIYR